jgi:lysophospholipase
MGHAPLFQIEGVPAGGNAIFVSAKDGTKIRVAYWHGGERGTVYLFPGRTEYIEKYGRMVAKLQDRNLNVVVIDWRGQGLSDHEDDRRDRGHVKNFQQYQQDIVAAINTSEVKALPGPRLLFSHSMGGCIALRALVDGLKVEGAVFSGPMWGLSAPKKDRLMIKFIDLLGRPYGKHKMLVPGEEPTYYAAVNPFEGNELTNDTDYYAMFQSHLAAQPDLGLGGPTIHWAVEAMKEMEALSRATVPDIPILTFLGDEESIVNPDAIKARAPGFPNTRFEIIETSKHEIWMETPKVQKQVWDITDQFLAQIL